jgi:sulfite exporter TauE/SafE
MHLKKYLGFAVCVVGVVLISYGLYSRSQVSGIEKKAHELSQSKNSLAKSVGKKVESKTGRHNAKMRWSLIGGVILLAVGVGTIYYLRKKRR